MGEREKMRGRGEREELQKVREKSSKGKIEMIKISRGRGCGIWGRDRDSKKAAIEEGGWTHRESKREAAQEGREQGRK